MPSQIKLCFRPGRLVKNSLVKQADRSGHDVPVSDEQRSREFADASYQVRRTRKFFDLAHKSAADHRGVCKTPDLANLFRR